MTPYKLPALRSRLGQPSMAVKPSEWMTWDLIPSSVGPVRAIGLTALGALAAEGAYQELFFHGYLTPKVIDRMTPADVGQYKKGVWVDFGLATVLSGLIGIATGMVLPALGSEAVGIYHLVSRLSKISEVEKRGAI